jgi:hypothetical protein
MSLPTHVQEMVNAAVKQDEADSDRIVFKTESEAIMAKSSAFADSFLHAADRAAEDALIKKHCPYGNTDLVAVREIYLIAMVKNFEFITTFERNCDPDDQTDPPEVASAIETNLYLMNKISGLMRRIYDEAIREDKELLAKQELEMERDGKILKTSTVHVAGVTEDGNIHLIQ